MILPIAVGVVINPKQEILVARRHQKQSQGNCWEFPGGKIESGETKYQALCRELKEEIGIEVQHASPLVDIPHDYDDYQVILHTWFVDQFSGTPQGLEGQPIQWISLSQLPALSMPAANYEIINYLQPLVISLG